MRSLGERGKASTGKMIYPYGALSHASGPGAFLLLYCISFPDFFLCFRSHFNSFSIAIL